jgi:hypothetical protein
MATESSKLTSKYQATIPEAVRKATVDMTFTGVLPAGTGAPTSAIMRR